MRTLDMGGFASEDAGEGEANLVRGTVGAIGGALALGVAYGVVGRFVGEFSYVAFLIGAASGVAAMKLAGGRTVTLGIIAAVAALVAVLLSKLIVGAPEGADFIAYHTTMFDILFCYVACPAAAFFAAGTDKARQLLKRLPV